jgi:hypothetical protein
MFRQDGNVEKPGPNLVTESIFMAYFSILQPFRQLYYINKTVWRNLNLNRASRYQGNRSLL